MTALLSIALPFLFKVIMWFIDRQNNNDKAKKQFLAFLAEMEQYLPRSAQLRDEYEKARQENLKNLGNNK